MGGTASGLGVHECKCVCAECKCESVAVWCSQAAPDVPRQSTAQKLFIGPGKGTAELRGDKQQDRCKHVYLQYAHIYSIYIYVHSLNATRVGPAEMSAHILPHMHQRGLLTCLRICRSAPGSDKKWPSFSPGLQNVACYWRQGA